MGSPSDKIGERQPPAETLPEYWPDGPVAQPVRPVWLPWPIAVVLAPLLWLLPKRMGVHFAAVRWPGVIVAHLVWTIYGIGCIAIAYWATGYSWAAYISGKSPGRDVSLLWPVTWLEIARSPLALLALGLAQKLDEFEDLMLGLGVLAGVELGLILVAELLTPYAAAGEKVRKLWGRCVKLTLWSTTSLVVLGLVLQAIELDLLPGDPPKEPLTILAVSGYVVWFVWIWMRSGSRYGGPAEGPGWDRRRPLCEECGYRLTGLTPASRCPECGTPVAGSLPQHRRPTPFAAASSPWARDPAFFRTFAGALTGRGFYKRLAILGGHAAARRFAIYVCVLCGPVYILTMSVSVLLSFDRSFVLEVFKNFFEPVDSFLGCVAVLVVTWVAVSVSLLGVLGFVGLLEPRFGYRPMHRSATVVFYWAAWLPPVVMAVAVATVLVIWFEEHGYMHGTTRVWFLGTIDNALIYGATPFALPLLVLTGALARLVQATRQTRFANA